MFKGKFRHQGDEVNDLRMHECWKSLKEPQFEVADEVVLERNLCERLISKCIWSEAKAKVATDKFTRVTSANLAKAWLS